MFVNHTHPEIRQIYETDDESKDFTLDLILIETR